MPRFFRRLSEGVFDLEDLRLRTAELDQFLAAAAERYRFTPATLYALGFSNGANIAASLLLSQPAALAGGILIRAMVPFEPERAPDLSGRAVLLSEGRNDPLIPAPRAQRLAEILQAAGADVELAWQPGGHALTQGDVTLARRWLGQRTARPAVV
jgi:phospholipase/carboxylesterase